MYLTSHFCLFPAPFPVEWPYSRGGWDPGAPPAGMHPPGLAGASLLLWLPVAFSLRCPRLAETGHGCWK